MIYQDRFLMIILLLSYLIHFCCVFSLSHAQINTTSPGVRCLPEQSSALLQLKREFIFDQRLFMGYNGGSPKMKSWKEGKDCCNWDGVTCDMATGHVVGLDLSQSWLQGSLLPNSSLLRLRRLQRLNLAFNNLNNSQIPSTFGQLTSLTHLNISNSMIAGHVPIEISRLANLVSLDLSCDIYGFLSINSATLIQNMTKLRILNLKKVKLSSLQAENFLGNSTSLTHLFLWGCILHGTFPKHILQLHSIETIDVSYNPNLTGLLPEFPLGSNLKSLILLSTQFSGILPYSIGNLRSLNILDLTGCKFSGAIPSSFGNLSQLTFLSIAANDLDNRLPSSLGNLYQLTHLDLSENNFNGPVPSALGNLSKLTFLDLSRNNFTSQITFALENLYQLTHFCLSWNNFFGQLHPDIGNLSQLTYLDLSSNNFNGQLPPTLGNLVNLANLNLNSSGFGGELPSSLGNLTSLQSLSLQMNNFTGQIPSSFGNLVQLTELFLGHNTFHGKFPLQVANLSQLLSLDLSHNHFRGPLPLIGSGLLDSLSLSYNSFTGVIPPSLFSSCSFLALDNNHFTSLPNLQNISSSKYYLYVDLRSNALHGSLIVPPQSTAYFFASENNLSGSLHQLFCNLTYLQILDVSNNNLNGTIPQCLGSFSSSLEVLNMQGNNFHGEIPQTFSDGNSLKTLDLSRNQLGGKVPESLIKCTSLQVLNLGHNQISDTFPFWLQNLPELQVLVLRFNKFYGPIWHPQKFHGFVKLRIVDLSFNNFSGNLPPQYFRNWSAINTKIPNANKSHLRYIEDRNGLYQVSVTVVNKGLMMPLVKVILSMFMSIDLSNNNVHGEIPSTVGALQSLIMLNLSSNDFQGLIPSTLGSLTELESLDLSCNKLSGRIPQELASLTFLQYLNLSNNQLIGQLPHGGHFDTFPNSSFDGNLDLCGFPLSKKCRSITDGTPTPDHNDHSEESESENGFGWKVALIGYGCGFVVGTIGAHLLVSKKSNWFLRIYGRKNVLKNMDC